MSASNMQDLAPDSTAARVALWRALHVEVDAPPHVLEDNVGLQLLAPEPGWQQRGDMHPEFTRPFRASIVARARFIEDLVVEQAARALSQYLYMLQVRAALPAPVSSSPARTRNDRACGGVRSAAGPTLPTARAPRHTSPPALSPVYA